jgi:hypothetical protein
VSTMSLGTLSILVTGLPFNCTAQIQITGPNNYSNTASLTGNWSAELINLEPGTYTLQPYSTRQNNVSWVPTQQSYQVTITPQSTTKQTITYSYSCTNPRASLSISIIGLPAENSTKVNVTGPNGYSSSHNIVGGATETLNGLNPGTYTVQPMEPGPRAWFTPQTSYTITLVAQNPATLTLQYSLQYYRTTASGLTVRVTGLPNNLLAQINGINPMGTYTKYIIGGTTCDWGEIPGDYLLQPQPVQAPRKTWVPIQSNISIHTFPRQTTYIDIKYV